MLIWKVIDANPGVTRQGIWARVEHDIPPGYARRLYARELEKSRRQDPSAVGIEKARGFVLTLRLHHLRQHGSVVWEGDGINRRYTVARQPEYRGDLDAIDETGTKAAEHMAIADALRIVEKMLARGDRERKHGPAFAGGRKEYDAIVLLVKAHRAN